MQHAVDIVFVSGYWVKLVQSVEGVKLCSNLHDTYIQTASVDKMCVSQHQFNAFWKFASHYTLICQHSSGMHRIYVNWHSSNCLQNKFVGGASNARLSAYIQFVSKCLEKYMFQAHFGRAYWWVCDALQRRICRCPSDNLTCVQVMSIDTRQIVHKTHFRRAHRRVSNAL